MPGLSSADHSVTPPRVEVPRDYNAAHDLLERNLRAGRQDKIAYIDDAGEYSFGELAARANRCGNALLTLGMHPEERVLLCLQDGIDFPSVFLGAIKAGIVPVAVNTLLPAQDLEHMLRDSRARVAVVSPALLPRFEAFAHRVPTLQALVVAGASAGAAASLPALMAAAPDGLDPAATCCDEACFWIYSSGSTGLPKGTVHRHANLIQVAEHYGRQVLGIAETDFVFSTAKLFFAYGLGNSLAFPLAHGATALLMAERATPEAVFARLARHRPSLFFAVPTLYASMLAHPDLPAREAMRVRHFISAGEALPAEVGRRWAARFGVDVLDGLGSTEMLNTFLSNRPGDLRYGTTGRPVPGYEVRLVDEEGRILDGGETGELQIRGPSSATAYWNNRERSQATFLGPWVRSGDKYSRTADGYYVYAGRSDDMLKVSGIYVSPIEVESALVSHEAVLEAAVVGDTDADGLTKPRAFVVLKDGHRPTPELAEALKRHVKERLAPYKYPRWVQFIAELPKTATGKIQRYKLRASLA